MRAVEIDPSVNVLGDILEPCGHDPVTGFFRNGCCDTNEQDHGSHTVCAVMTDEFLRFSKKMGNDLSTPRPEFGFDGLKAGDRWCLCAARYLEAWNAGLAPKVKLSATHRRALEVVPLNALRANALDEM